MPTIGLAARVFSTRHLLVGPSQDWASSSEARTQAREGGRLHATTIDRDLVGRYKVARDHTVRRRPAAADRRPVDARVGTQNVVGPGDIRQGFLRAAVAVRALGSALVATVG